MPATKKQPEKEAPKEEAPKRDLAKEIQGVKTVQELRAFLLRLTEKELKAARPAAEKKFAELG